MAKYEIKNNAIVKNYGNNKVGNACTPIDLINDGYQYKVKTPCIEYQGYDWSCVDATPIEVEETKNKVVKKTTKKRRFFGLF